MSTTELNDLMARHQRLVKLEEKAERLYMGTGTVDALCRHSEILMAMFRAERIINEYAFAY